MRQNMISILLGALGIAAAAPTTPQAGTSHNLLLSGLYQIQSITFTGNSFAIASTSNYGANDLTPTWVLPGPNNDVLYAVNEYTNGTSSFSATDDDSTGAYAWDGASPGSTGIVHLAFTADKSTVVGSGYGSGMIDIYTVTDQQKLQSKKKIEVTGPLGPEQESHRPHQAVLDPTGSFFVIPDLGGDQLLVLDATSFEVTGTVKTPAGTGPRHGVFISSPSNGSVASTTLASRAAPKKATHFAAVTELSNEILLFSISYSGDGTPSFTQTQRISTFDPSSPPATPDAAAAAEIQVSADMAHVYVSNRITGNDSGDTISHFTFSPSSSGLEFADELSYGGTYPRMFSLSRDRDSSFLFIASQGGEYGLLAFSRCKSSGKLSAKPVATLAMAQVSHAKSIEASPDTPGPMWVEEI